jgi:hypothetical protein
VIPLSRKKGQNRDAPQQKPQAIPIINKQRYFCHYIPLERDVQVINLFKFPPGGNFGVLFTIMGQIRLLW